MFKLPTWGGRYNPFINAFKARGILNSNRNIKAHGNLIKRCIKNVPITLTDVKKKSRIRRKIDSCVLTVCEPTRIEVIRIFSASPAQFEG